MIGGLHQRYCKNAVINVLKAWGGEAYGRDGIDALVSAPKFKLLIYRTEKVCNLSPCSPSLIKGRGE